MTTRTDERRWSLLRAVTAGRPRAQALAASRPPAAEDPFTHCARLMTAKARTFSFAGRWLPADIRRDVSALYAFFRTIDDLVDERPPTVSIAEVQCQLDLWRRWLSRPEPYGSLVQQAFGDVLLRRNLSVTPLLELIDGCEADLTLTHIETEQDLDRYCYLVAGTVGLAMAELLGAREPEAARTAALLGAAMQRTNIIRDVREDAARGRVYLSAESLAEVEITPQDVLNGQNDGRLQCVIAGQIDIARREYNDGLAGVAYLPAWARLPITIAGRLYERILTKVERQQYDVFVRRASTSRTEKALVAVNVALRGAWRRNPPCVSP